LRGAEHLDGLLHALDGDFGDHDGRRLDGEVRREHGQQVAMAGALAGQGVGEGGADRTFFAADQQINVSNLVPVTNQSFANKHRHG
jgi:hypothetical protein